MEIMKRTDEIRVDTEAEAKALIESFKEKRKKKPMKWLAIHLH